MDHPAPELLVVMPVYNEQASVRKVAMEFFEEIENWTERFVFLALDARIGTIKRIDLL